MRSARDGALGGGVRSACTANGAAGASSSASRRPGVPPPAQGAGGVTRCDWVAVEVQLQEMTVMSATLDEIQKQHQAIKTRVRPALPQPALAPAFLYALQHACSLHTSTRVLPASRPSRPRGAPHNSVPHHLPFLPLAQYEEEIKYLRMQVEAAGGQVQPRMESSSSVIKLEPGSSQGGLTADILAQRGNSLLDLYASGQCSVPCPHPPPRARG